MHKWKFESFAKTKDFGQLRKHNIDNLESWLLKQKFSLLKVIEASALAYFAQ